MAVADSLETRAPPPEIGACSPFHSVYLSEIEVVSGLEV